MVAVGYLGVCVSVVNAATPGHAPTRLGPVARAAYANPNVLSCAAATGDAINDPNSAAWQTYAMRYQLRALCTNSLAQLGDVADALGTLNASTGVWGPYGIGADMNSARWDIADVRKWLGKCPTTTCTGAAASLWSEADATRLGVDALKDVPAKLDTLHADLGAIKAAIEAQGPNTGAPAAPGGSDTAPAYVRFASGETAPAYQHADMWWLMGLITALFFGSKLYRLVMPRA